MASGPGVSKPNMAGHPKRKVSREDYVHDPDRGYYAEWEEKQGPMTLGRIGRNFVSRLRGVEPDVPPPLRGK